MLRYPATTRAHAIAELRQILPPGTTVHTVIRHANPRTQRHTISVFRLSAGEALCLDFWVMRALDLAHDHTHGGMRVTAYGADIVYRLATLLHGEWGALRHINL